MVYNCFGGREAAFFQKGNIFKHDFISNFAVYYSANIGDTLDPIILLESCEFGLHMECVRKEIGVMMLECHEQK